MGSIERLFELHQRQFQPIVELCAQELWCSDCHTHRKPLIDLIGQVHGFRQPSTSQPWSRLSPAVHIIACKGTAQQILHIASLCFMTERFARTCEYYRGLGVEGTSDAARMRSDPGPPPTVDKFLALHDQLAPPDRPEYLLWIGVVALGGRPEWKPVADEALAALLDTQFKVVNSPITLIPSVTLPPTPSVLSETADCKAEESASPRMLEISLQPEPVSASPTETSTPRGKALITLTPLDNVFIDLAVAAVEGQQRAQTADEVMALIEELVSLNSKRVTSRFHRGFLAALTKAELPTFIGAENESRRAWLIAGWLLGHCRYEGNAAYARFEALSAADLRCLMSQPEAVGLLADHYVRILSETARPSDLVRWIRSASEAGRLVAITNAQELLRGGKPSDARALASAVISAEVETSHSAALGTYLRACIVDGTAARMLGDFDGCDARLNIVTSVVNDIRVHLSSIPNDAKLNFDIDELESAANAQSILCAARIRMVERVWFGSSPQDRSVQLTLNPVADRILMEIRNQDRVPSTTIAYCASMLVLSSPEFRDSSALGDCEAAVTRVLTGSGSGSMSSLASSLLPRLRVLRALMRAQRGGADLIEAISTVAAYESASELLPIHVIRAVIVYGLTEQADGVADLIVPRLQTELPTLLSEGFLVAALSNRKVSGELASHVTEYVRPLQGPKQVEVRADLFATLVDANGPRHEVVRMADELIGTVQSYPASAPRAIQVLLLHDRWTRVWTDDDFAAVHASLAATCDDAHKLAARKRLMARARYLSREDPDTAEECLEMADWLGEPLATIGEVRNMVERLAPRVPVRDDSVAAKRLARVLFVGGAEPQRKLHQKITETVDLLRPNVKIGFEHPGWGSNWSPKLEATVNRLKDFDIVVLLRFTRTIYGERLRDAIGRAGKQWRPTYGHGAPSIARAIAAAADDFAG